MKSIEELLKELTLEEKITMIHGSEFFKTGAVERLGIPSLVSSDGPAGVRQDFEPDSWTPINDGGDRVSWLPSNSCLASSWDQNMAYEFGRILGDESRGRGKDVILAPGINIKRTPLCGRNFEYMSEDPYLTAAMAVPLIKGIQEYNVAACVKHFALNNQEMERMSVEAIVDERTLREIYLPAFQACIRQKVDGDDERTTLAAHSLSIMASYNKVRGEQACASKFLLQDVLRDEWGYDGVVISDWGGVHDTKKSALNGMDIEMSVTPDFDEYYFAKPLLEAVKKGEIDESVIDEKVRRILLLMTRLHMLDDSRTPGTYNYPAHQVRIQRIAEESIVLLKNETNHLPLDKNVKKIAVIGDNATRSHANGGGSAEIKALYDISPLLGLKMYLGGNTEVLYTPGYYIDNEEKVIGEVDWQATSLAVDYSTPDNKKRFEEEILPKRQEYMKKALELADTCDEVIFVGGLNHAYDVEGFDRPDMKLPYGQDELIDALLDQHPEMTIVLINGSPVEMPWLDKARSLVQTSYCGMNGGSAIARVLFGTVNPSGRLTESYPLKLEDSPAHVLGQYPGTKEGDEHRKVEYGEGLMVGYRYFTTTNKPVAFPFGHGLSYTNFEYSDIRTIVKRKAFKDDIRVDVSFALHNTGNRAGKEVVQLYIGQKDAPVARPLYELKAFKKVQVEPEEECEVTLKLNKHAFSYYDMESKSFVAKEGTYQIYIGRSASDIRLTGEIVIPKTYEGMKTLYK